MSIETIVLALANALRPAGLAAVYALLCAPRPRLLLAVFIAVGYVWSCLIGGLLVGALHGFNLATGDADAAVALVLGVAALVLAERLARGRTVWTPRGKPREEPSRLQRSFRDPSLTVVAGAAILTHLPGVLYLLAMNSIAATDPRRREAVAYLLVFNAIWFAPAIASLVLSSIRMQETRDALGRLNAWTRDHQAPIMAAILGLAGGYFVAKGALILLG